MTTYTINEQQMHRILDAIDFVCREGDRELPETTLVEVLTMLSNLQPNTQEPVAWGMQNDDGEIYECVQANRIYLDAINEYIIPLFTHPTPQQNQ